MPVLMADGRRATLRNFSASGLYLAIPPGPLPDLWVAIDVTLLDKGLRARALGEVIRTETQANGSLGVAMRLHRLRIRRLP